MRRGIWITGKFTDLKARVYIRRPLSSKLLNGKEYFELFFLDLVLLPGMSALGHKLIRFWVL